MAAITANSVGRESMGSTTLLIVSLTVGSTSDTYVISTSTAVVGFWLQGNVGTAGYSGDVTYTASTGTFLITSAQTGARTLYILVRG
jgi:hypothetical protein